MTNINAGMMRNAIKSAIKNLDVNKEMVNSLNVFPVPDGDTGINMFLTIKSAGNYALAEETTHCGELSQALSKGALMGARGNSGVILSQILRGFYMGIQDFKELDVRAIKRGFESSKEIAYKAVMKPTEGTILSVVRYMAAFAVSNQSKYSDTIEYLEAIYAEGERALEKTPEMLPVLKEAGVVDSGGKGLLVLMRGAIDGLKGEEVQYTAEVVETKTQEVHFDENIKFGYCTEFIIHTDNTDQHDADTLKEELLKFGDSLVCVKVEDIIKVHVHTNHPGKALELALERGYLTGIKSDNMRLQNAEVRRAHEEEQQKKYESLKAQDAGPQKEYGFVAVASGDGIMSVFKDFEVDEIVSGGQTMNPSVEDLTKKIEKINAKTIFVLPNNSNIVLTAQKAAEVSDKNVIVIPTKTIPQGISAMINFDFDLDLDDAIETLNDAIKAVKSGSITYAVRDTTVSGKKINQGDYMGILESEIVSSSEDIYETVLETLKKGVDEDSSIITLYAGQDVTEVQMEELIEKLENEFDDITIEGLMGNQQVYYYLISIE
ncbi:DAK2 domain-containing protein [Ezakiella coagulans]|uniref:DAK2 domain-containing protein n=1 Tax=Ezakiella coagulans TaxID=46507 RepID=UPI002014FB3E|nr:DAK2 domain-containing protein [Ezakiella coagulans]UQK60639.1 DAK2 domain-containing protein [Ezakiella coagulans]